MKKEELDNLMKKYNVPRIWSWSKINTYHNSPYEYYLKYIAHKKSDRNDCIYTTMGGMVHNIIEDFYSQKISYEDLKNEFKDSWLIAEMAELKFDRNDAEKDKKIRNKYYENLEHFFINHRIIPYKIEIERLITAMISGNLFYGFIDACFKDKNGYFNIMDFKTSTIYKGNKALNECGQLVVYAIGLHQMGVPYEKIKICWNFLKYVEVEYKQINGKINTREIERREIGNKLQSNVKLWLKKFGYESKTQKYLTELSVQNDIFCLPIEVQEMFKVKDCIVYVNLTKELINRWVKQITETINEIEKKEEQYKGTTDESIFFESIEDVEKNSYYFSTLCSYSPNLYKPYKMYLDKLDSDKNKNNLFTGVGTEANKSQKEDDMSWLDQL